MPVYNQRPISGSRKWTATSARTEFRCRIHPDVETNVFYPSALLAPSVYLAGVLYDNPLCRKLPWIYIRGSGSPTEARVGASREL